MKRDTGSPLRDPRIVLIAWGPVLGWLGLMTFLSHQSALPLPRLIPDWVLHGLEFALLAWLMARAVMLSGFSLGITTALLIVLACAAVGSGDEIHQSYVAGRRSSLRDLAADVGGASLCLGVLLGQGRFRLDEKPADSIDLVLVSRRDCSLCDEAAAVLDEELRPRGLEYTIRKVEDHEDLERRYGAVVPVVLVDDRMVFKYRVDRRRLRRLLEARRLG